MRNDLDVDGRALPMRGGGWTRYWNHSRRSTCGARVSLFATRAPDLPWHNSSRNLIDPTLALWLSIRACLTVIFQSRYYLSQ